MKLQYTPLDESKNEIRLITILPKSLDSDEIHCTLETKSLNSITPQYKDFLSSSNTPIVNARKAVADWARSHFSSQAHLPSHSYIHSPTPIDSCRRFTWGDYAALSYVWGDESKPRSIIVNGKDVQVTRNLEGALRAFQEQAEFADGFRLWVDAISINQQDSEERGRQVQRMRDIYRNAWTVLAWLGESRYGSDEAIQLVRNLCHFAVSNRGKELEAYLRTEPDYLGHGCWLALQELMDRPYWSRVWIIQEIIMGSSAVAIRCGNSSIDWTSFCAGIGVLQEHLWLVKDGLLAREVAEQKSGADPRWTTVSLHLVYQDLSVLSEREENEQEHLSFGRILDIANSAHCRDLRDKVYGLVGIMDPRIAQQLMPDYSSEPSKIYAAVSRAFIQTYCDMEPIREGNPWGPTNSPSWAADWNWNGRIRYSRVENGVWGQFWISKKPISTVPAAIAYCASGTSRQECSFSDDGLLLGCSGFVVDSIAQLAARGRGYFDWLETSIVQSAGWKSVYGDDSGTTKALYHALVADRVGHGMRASERHAAILSLPATFAVAQPQFQKLGWTWLATQRGYYFRWEKWRAANSNFLLGDRRLDEYFSSNISVDASEYDYSEVYTCFDRTSKKRRLMTTKKGYLGWAPDNIYGSDSDQTWQGDLIAIIFGCSTPVVIRPYGQRFKVIGEAYVQGLMDGEAMELLKSGGVQSQNFVFC